MWTEIHIQPMDVDNMPNSKVYWIKHPQINTTVVDKELPVAIDGFIKVWTENKK